MMAVQKHGFVWENERKLNVYRVKYIIMMAVQKHGFVWENELKLNVYRVKGDIKYTSVMDIPADLNLLTGIDQSIKTTGSKNQVCLGDAVRIFDNVSSGKPYHMTCLHYIQNTTDTKKVEWIVELDLTSSKDILFGDVTRDEIESLSQLVKTVPAKRKPTSDEHNRMYTLRNNIQSKSGFLKFAIKCNSTQSRLQCTFSSFQKFLETHQERIVAYSNTNEFRGGVVSNSIQSGRRILKNTVDNSSNLTL